MSTSDKEQHLMTLRENFALRTDVDMIAIGCRDHQSDETIETTITLTNITDDPYVFKMKSKISQHMQTMGEDVILEPQKDSKVTLIFKNFEALLKRKKFQIAIYHMKIGYGDIGRKPSDIWGEKKSKSRDSDGLKDIAILLLPKEKGIWRVPSGDFF